jgi:hypothetical protein
VRADDLRTAALLYIGTGLTRKQEITLADELSTIACEILKGEHKRGKVILMDVPADGE